MKQIYDLWLFGDNTLVDYGGYKKIIFIELVKTGCIKILPIDGNYSYCQIKNKKA